MTTKWAFKYCYTFILTPIVIQTIITSTVACKKLKTIVQHFPNKKLFNRLVKNYLLKEKTSYKKNLCSSLVGPPAPAFMLIPKNYFLTF